MRPGRAALALDAAIKVATVALLALALLAPELPQFQGKAFTGRAAAYPIALAAVPILWWLFGRARVTFPVATDILLGLPFLVDMAGNALNLYNTIEWWDDANHLVNWALHTSAVVLLVRGRFSPAAMVAVGVAWAASTAILWELAEYVAFVPDSPEAATAYRDTLGDLALGLLGGTVAAIGVARWTTRARTAGKARADVVEATVGTGPVG